MKCSRKNRLLSPMPYGYLGEFVATLLPPVGQLVLSRLLSLPSTFGHLSPNCRCPSWDTIRLPIAHPPNSGHAPIKVSPQPPTSSVLLPDHGRHSPSKTLQNPLRSFYPSFLSLKVAHKQFHGKKLKRKTFS
ncbi:hypothetical protein, unlikely [Trypanosoma congolense IL3000]|uniref:Uncharacterized protein n=1 Tax=Trypanosoma congolense (strain IL3000) TaxID=1068625 RepID=F9WAL0_TRYCI|nr:hypothetical protein, unlikely [Trypanosoma congolense IL3000]